MDRKKLDEVIRSMRDDEQIPMGQWRPVVYGYIDETRANSPSLAILSSRHPELYQRICDAESKINELAKQQEASVCDVIDTLSEWRRLMLRGSFAHR